MDLEILEKPRILNAQRAAILAQIAAIVLLLRLAFKFVAKTTILFTKLHQTDDPATKDKLKPPSIPKSILNLIQTAINRSKTRQNFPCPFKGPS